jgi:carbamate kinase
MKRMVLAVGGNSLIRAREKGTISEEIANTRKIAAQIIGLIREGYRIVLTHGNGPQVGEELLAHERAIDNAAGYPLDMCDAATQGEIGYQLQQALDNEVNLAGLLVPIIALVTQCVVSLCDPSMSHPTKPIGSFYSCAEAEERRRLFGWELIEDADRGYRRVVPSPEPIEIVELDVIRELTESGVLVIACGGGGIPVARVNQRLQGAEAVIDKDLTSALLATKLGAELLVIVTDTDFVYLDYKKPTQRPLERVSSAELDSYARAGHFPAGNMGPKIESVLRFLRAGGTEAIITSCDNLFAAVRGKAGTHITSVP